ncbi:MAG: stearoyl-CoA desaturase (delta-9 desaturase) [Planctomycetota bacterium]|jgi:stearoyl-CoA desaturase (delta-9 desaturase)
MEAGTNAPTIGKPKKINWLNLLFISGTHVLAILTIVWMVMVNFSWWTVGLGVLWHLCASIAITGGYHRLFAHRAYKASWPVRLFYLSFGAAGLQNSALKWSADHRVHHREVDTKKDPYNIQKGFWWAHILWVFYMEPGRPIVGVDDLKRDKLVMFQHNYYMRLGTVVGVITPFLLGFLWGDPIGAVLTCGFLRLAIQYHVTFSINSFTHMFGKQPYSVDNSSRDSLISAVITMGEGYHNYHHRFQADYRNGIRWYHFDPTKWFVFSLSKVGLTSDLRATTREKIERARASVIAQKNAAKLSLADKSTSAAQSLSGRAESAKQAFAEGSASAKQAFAEGSASAKLAFAETSASAKLAFAETSASAKQALSDTADSANALAHNLLDPSLRVAPVLADDPPRNKQR